ncbi:hypothetical protein MNBD_NITROSPINAE04-1750 [hydrothermal vent metagenome]|uniref:RDD domain-containing protein n=1 Tax=hydrothermal vent metagenome TaxID=652676 RepID=A0A3B1C6F4_9ZZZZ
MDDFPQTLAENNESSTVPPDIPEKPIVVDEIKYASFSRRFTAYTLDSLLLFVVTFVIIVLAIKISGSQMDVLDPINILEKLDVIIWLVIAFNTIASVGYFTIMIGSGGMTIGKRLVGIKVIAQDGSEVSYIKAFIRYIGYFVSAFFLYIGFLLALIDSRHQTFHDKIAGTVVVEID